MYTSKHVCAYTIKTCTCLHKCIFQNMCVLHTCSDLTYTNACITTRVCLHKCIHQNMYVLTQSKHVCAYTNAYFRTCVCYIHVLIWLVSQHVCADTMWRVGEAFPVCIYVHVCVYVPEAGGGLPREVVRGVVAAVAVQIVIAYVSVWCVLCEHVLLLLLLCKLALRM